MTASAQSPTGLPIGRKEVDVVFDRFHEQVDIAEILLRIVVHEVSKCRAPNAAFMV